MNRSEYRRAFIMLRSARQGYSGHARLERRTLTGSLYFIITAPEGAGPLRAALAGQRDGRYYVAPIGAFNRDRRGQLTLAWQFDPRSIDGRPLEAYAWVVVADTAGSCGLVLTGNVEGSRQVDAAALERAVCDALSDRDAPAADLPEAAPPTEPTEPTEPPTTGPLFTLSADPPEAAPSVQPPEPPATGPLFTLPADPPEAAPSVQPPEPPATGPLFTLSADPPEAAPPTEPSEPDPGSASEDEGQAARCDIKIYTGSRARVFTRADPADADGGGSAPAASPETGIPHDDPDAEDTPARESPRDPGEDEAAYEPSSTAAQVLGLDITEPWSATLEPLRRLFATQAPASPSPDGEYVYISAPMPKGSGYAACLIGLNAENGRAAGIRYALPSRYAPQPPAGLEGYRWLGGGGEGWWVLDVPAD